jgi:hypothetical protein
MAIQDRNLSVGTRLYARFKGETHTAELVEKEGAKLYRLSDGREFKSPPPPARRSPGRPATAGPSGRWAMAARPPSQPSLSSRSRLRPSRRRRSRAPSDAGANRRRSRPPPTPRMATRRATTRPQPPSRTTSHHMRGVPRDVPQRRSGNRALLRGTASPRVTSPAPSLCQRGPGEQPPMGAACLVAQQR